MTAQYLANYRGQINGLVAHGTQAAFISSHPEGQATALYRLNAAQEVITLTTEALPCGATALVSDGKTLWFAGQDGKIYQSPLAKGKPKALPSLHFADAEHSHTHVGGLALLAGNQLAVIHGKQLHIIDSKAGKILQSFSSPDYLTALSSHTDGTCLAVGNSKGHISVYRNDEHNSTTNTSSESPAFTLSSEGRIHEGKVTAIQFEANELRFYSSGADKKLFSTHAQGKLQPLDKGRSSNHDANISAIHLGAERFFTASADKTLKSWAYSGGQPVTFKEGSPKYTALATITYRDKPCLLAAAANASLRFIALTDEEKFGELRLILCDGYQQAAQYLDDSDPTRREQGINQLANYDDKKSLELIVKHFSDEKDKALRDHIVESLTQSQHPYSTQILEGLLKDKRNESVRQQALAGLIKRASTGDLSPYEKALDSDFADIGSEALALLAKLAKKESRAVQLIVQALQHKKSRLRLLALSLLEKIYDKASPKASLQGLQSHYPDLQRAALIRLFQRKLLDDIDVKRAILRAQDHDDAQLRHTAFLVAVLSQKALTQALKTREPDLARQLQEIEDFELLATDTSTTATTNEQHSKIGALVNTLKQVAGKASPTPSRPYPLSKLSHDDFTVLLQGMSNRHADICFMSAFSLAILEDQRAFGLLLLLSQEKDSAIRAGVCRAFGWLKQADSIQSLELMLNDAEASVRDAAFSALQTLQSDGLLVAQRGLASQHEDIHARSLKTLLDTFGNKLSKVAHQRALALINTALNDPFPAIRQETFKACLNRQLGGDETATLQLLMASRFENVHQEILNEVMAASKKLPVLAWVEPLLFQLFNDNFVEIRDAALRFALAEKKRFDEQIVFAHAVASEFFDVRHAVFRHIEHKPTKANQVHIEKLTTDEVALLRNTALYTLAQCNNRNAIRETLKSPYDDTRVNAAYALACWGDPQSYPVLETFLSSEEPRKKAEQQEWVGVIGQALKGVAALGDSRAFPFVLHFTGHNNKALSEQAAAALPVTTNPLMRTNDKTVMEEAAKALPWVVTAEHIPALRTLQASENKTLQVQAGFALALLKQPSEQTEQGMDSSISIHHQLAATLCTTAVNPVSLQPFFMDKKTLISALISLASHELLLHGDEPALSTRALSIAKPEVQIFCAELMTRYSDAGARWEFLRHWLVQSYREQNDEKWDISIASLQQIAAVLVYGEGAVKAHLLTVLALIDEHKPLKTWDLYFETFAQRHAAPIAAAEQQVTPPVDIKPLQTTWNQRAFGAYLGVVRQDPPNRNTRYQNINPRLKALRSMDALATQDQSLRETVNSCFLTLLNHNQSGIRQLAFDKLKASTIDPALLGNTATTSPQSDIATQGLALLTQHYPIKQSRKLLESLIRGDNKTLSSAAYQLYSDDSGLTKAAEFALESNTLSLRQRCVAELAAHYEDSAAQQWLVQTASQNDNAYTAITAAKHLAQHKHPKAFAILTKRLDHTTDESEQNALRKSLRMLPDVAVAEYLLDYLLNNPLNRMSNDRLYHMIATYRPLGLADTLFKSLETRPNEASDIAQTLITISGYDQPIEDYDTEQADRSWLDKQHPRHDALLIRLFTTLIKLDRHDAAMRLSTAMGWTTDPAADQALLDAIPVIAEKYLAQLIEIIVYRAERRDGSITGLIKVLDHKNSTVQFLAAEGLANHGHAQGFNVLFAAMDYQDDFDYRQRAVLALGKLADQRALDKLLKLAEDHEHALHETAIEAIGFMGESEHHEKIFKLLKGALAKAGYYSNMTEHALNGLRWFNTLESWQLIHAFIANTDHSWSYRQSAVELLEHHDSEATRDLLLKLLRTECDDDVVEAAYLTARKLWQNSTEPKHADKTNGKPSELNASSASSHQSSHAVDCALIQGYHPDTDDEALKRIVRDAPTATLLTLLDTDFPSTGYAAGIIQQLGNSLLKRDDIRASDLEDGLQSNNAAVISIVARLLSRMDTINTVVKGHLEQATQRYFQAWQDQYQQLKIVDDWERRERLMETEQVVLQLLWSSTQHAVFSPTLLERLSTTDKAQRVFQIQILTALLTLDDLNDKTLLSSLQQLVDSPLLTVSTLANQLLAKQGSENTQPLNWERFLTQPQSLLNQQFTQPLQQAATESAHQAQALPLLIRKQDVATLSTIAADTQQQESLRMGAIEGLACIAGNQAAAALKKISTESSDKDLAKAAYRALRRQQRRQQKADALSKKMAEQNNAAAGA